MKYDKSVNRVYKTEEEYIKDCYGGLPNEAMLSEQYAALPDVYIGYDSRNDTLLHIKRVSELLVLGSQELLQRCILHDLSKLNSPEKELFDEYTPKLKGSTYGSEEYKSFLSGLKVALDHHYENNSHHPEHYENGVNGMNLFDLIEMFFDWKAAGERHADGNIYKSIEINKDRFELSEQLKQILINTAKYLKY